MITASEQQGLGFHAFRMAPAIAKGILDPFLSLSFVRLRQPSMTRPQAGYTSVYWVDPSSSSGLRIETGLLGTRIVTPGAAQAIFCGNGVVMRLSPEHKAVRFIELEVKIAMKEEHQRAHWAEVVGSIEKGMHIVDHNPSFFYARSTGVPDFWKDENNIQICSSLSGDLWNRSPFVDQEQWFFQGRPLQEPVDRFSSLAMCDRVYNRLVLRAYKNGELGQLSL